MVSRSNSFRGGGGGDQTHVLMKKKKILSIMTCLLSFCNLLAGVTCAQRSLVSKSMRGDVTSSRRISAEDVSASSYDDTDSVDFLWERNLSSGLSTPSAPSPASWQNDGAESVLSGQKLSLRSSTYNVSGIGGHRIYAIPIVSSELTEILDAAHADLQRRSNHVLDDVSYHVNTTKWSFIVVSANKSLHYNAIQSVVSHFIKLLSKTAAPQDIVSTRVGVLLLAGTEAVADITIMPHRIITNSSYIPFSNFGHHQSPKPQPEEIMNLTPAGSTCAYEKVNETAALAPFSDAHGSSRMMIQDLTPRSLETEMMMRVADTMYLSTLHLWRRPDDGLPVQIKTWALKAIICIASWQIMIGASFGVFDMPSMARFNGGGSFIADWGFDTGFYAVGRQLARFALNDTGTFKNPLSVQVLLWLQIIESFLNKLRELEDQVETWALEGEIYLPVNATRVGNGTWQEGGEEGEREVVARWQIWMGDAQES